MMTAPERLKAWREQEGLTQAAASQRAGVSQATWCDWENGNKVPRVDKASDLAKLTKGPHQVTSEHWADWLRAKGDAA